MKFDSYPTVNKFLLPILVLAALLGSYVVAQATGFWAVSGKAMVDLENLTSSADIRGWMTLDQVIQGFGIPQADLYAALSIPAGIPTSTPIKDLEGIVPGFEVTLVREAVDAFLSGAPLPHRLRLKRRRPLPLPPCSPHHSQPPTCPRARGPARAKVPGPPRSPPDRSCPPARSKAVIP
jgi:hypothetical protein